MAKAPKAVLPEGATRAKAVGTVPQGPSPVYRAKDNWKPPVKQKKSAQTRLSNQRTAQREAFEASPDVVKGSGMGATSGQARMQRPAIFDGPLPASRVYAEMGWHDNSTMHEDQQTLPGMGSLREGREAGLVSPTGGHGVLPDTVPVARWHHLSNTEKMGAEAHALRFGVTRASAKAAFSANLDNSYANADAADTTPHARDFYSDSSPHMPAGHIVEASRTSGHSVSAIATGVSMTSPQTEWGPTDEGNYPNIRAARHAALAPTDAPLTKAGIGHPTISDDSTKKIGTFTGNVVKAARAIREQAGGTTAADLRSEGTERNPAGSQLFGGKTQQKTTAFRNALVDPEGPEASFVSDVHSGGRGMAPHLSPTQAGEYLKHPAIHQFHDDIAREVMRERGLQSINHVQAAQWGQAQIDSGQVSPEKAFSKPPKLHESTGQMDMFSGHVEAHAAAQVHVDAAEDQTWTAGLEARANAVQRKRRRTQPGMADRTAGVDPNYRVPEGQW